MKQIGIPFFILSCLTGLLAAQPMQPPQTRTSSTPTQYEAKDFSYLLGNSKISDKTLSAHFKLYQGYVKNTNLLLEILKNCMKEGQDRTPQCAEIRRRLGFEFDGMRLHEYYFSNLGGSKTKIDTQGPLYKRIVQDFGSYDAWEKDFKATGAMRGVGWAILYLDPAQGRLVNVWIDDHQNGHFAAANPILIMDIWEHAYMLDYGIDRGSYIDAFMKDINWDVVQKRFPDSSFHSGR